jgi:hypothetical protein
VNFLQGHEELLSAVVSALEELARSGHAASIEDLVSSKGKGDYENIKIDLTRAANDDNEVSDSEDVEEEPAIPPAPPAPSVVSLPPPPSALCDCHGAIACPFLSQQFSHFTCGICVDSFVPGKVRPYHSPNCHTNCCDDCLSETLSFSIRNGQVRLFVLGSCLFSKARKKKKKKTGEEHQLSVVQLSLDAVGSCSSH